MLFFVSSAHSLPQSEVFPETWGNTAQFPPYGLSTAPAAAVRHLRCQNARYDIQWYLRFWLSICRTSLAVSALRIMRYCPGNMIKGAAR